MVQRVLEGEPTNPGLRPATDFTDILSGEITSILKLASFLIPKLQQDKVNQRGGFAAAGYKI